MNAPSPWLRVTGRLALVNALAVVAGLVFGAVQWWIAGAMAMYLAWHLWHLYRLERWFRLKRGPGPRDAPGIWGEVYAQIHRLRRRNRRRKKRLSRVLKEFRKSTAALPDAGVVLSPEHEITWINDAAVRMLGLSKADRGQRLDNFLRDPAFVEYLQGGDYADGVLTKSPVDPSVQLSMRVVPYGEGQRLLLARDITDQVRLEKVRRNFVANASHELRSPLTVITGYLDSLGSDPTLPESWQVPVDQMRIQAARMGGIIEDMLELSRLESRGRSAPADEVDVPGMLSLIKKELVANPSHRREVTLDLDAHDHLVGSEAELYSAFTNLVNNAVKYTADAGRIELRWSVDQEGGHFEVRDDGMGIPADAIPRLTERFYRVDKGRDRATGGTGLGLAIVKHVLSRHDGYLEIESEPGEGSTFTCHFPTGRLSPAPHEQLEEA